MKKATLKEVIQNIVAQKLSEAKTGKPAEFGYVIAGKGTEDPTFQMNGFGNMKKSSWKKKIEHDVKDLLARVQADDWHGATHYLQPNGVLFSAINMMAEILDDPKLKEDMSGGSAQAANPTVNSASPADRVKLELAKAEKQLGDTASHIKELEASIAKRMEAVNKANKQDENRKEQLTKQQGPMIHKIEQLKKKIGSTTPTDVAQAIQETEVEEPDFKAFRHQRNHDMGDAVRKHLGVEDFKAGDRVRLINPSGYKDYQGTIKKVEFKGKTGPWADIKWDTPVHPCTTPIETKHLEKVEE